MEKIIFTFLTALLVGYSSHAQSSYEEGMKKALDLWEQNKASEAVAQFELVAQTEAEQWLPYYYASEIKIVEAFAMTDAAIKEQELTEAQELLDQARKHGGAENAEIMVLQAMLHTAYITLDPYFYGQSLAPVVEEIYEKAYRIAPENPRVVLSKAEWKMGAAPYFGEDPKKYCEDLKKSLSLFRKYPSTEAFAPSWGEDRAEMLISATCGND